MRDIHWGRLLPALLFLTSGCASIPPDVKSLPPDAVPIELQDTPFFAQQEFQCGPAALTTVLVASGAEVLLDDIVSKVYVPGREGSLQAEMLAASRTSARLPYVIDRRLTAINDELAAGRAVVILQNLGVAAIPVWHYAVVIGIHADRGVVVLRSGTDRRREMRIATFLRTWRRSDYWGMVVLVPGELPTNVERQRYLAAVAALEGAGQTAPAELAWRAALIEWPDDVTASFGLGNVLAAQGDLVSAIAVFTSLLDRNPELIVARNNLALALARIGQFDEADRQIDRALLDNVNDKLEPELLDTQAIISHRRDAAN